MEKVKGFFKQYPIFGKRTLKTVLSVLLTSIFMKYVLKQNPFFACIGAVVAMERTMERSIHAAIIRNVGTIVGGVIGMGVSTYTENLVLMALGLIPFIWVSNALNKKETIVPGAIVYFAVFFLNTMDTAWVYGLTRIFGTLVGSLISIGVNLLVFPPKGDKAS